MLASFSSSSANAGPADLAMLLLSSSVCVDGRGAGIPYRKDKYGISTGHHDVLLSYLACKGPKPAPEFVVKAEMGYLFGVAVLYMYENFIKYVSIPILYDTMPPRTHTNPRR